MEKKSDTWHYAIIQPVNFLDNPSPMPVIDTIKMTLNFPRPVTKQKADTTLETWAINLFKGLCRQKGIDLYD